MKKILFLIIFLVICVAAFIRYKVNDSASFPILYGNVETRDVNLGFRVSGRIAQLNKREGDSVKAGDILAVLDPSLLKQNYRVKKAEFWQARVIFDHAEKEYKRQEALHALHAVSVRSYEQALEKRDTAKAQVLVAQSILNLAKINLQDTLLRAPEDGVVLTRVVEKGSIVNVGQVVYALTLKDPLWVRSYIDEPNLGLIEKGQKATITTDSGQSYEAILSFISPQAEFTPKSVETMQMRTDLVYRLRFLVPHSDSGLKQGMPVNVVMIFNKKKH